MLFWLPQLTKDWKRYLMGWVLKGGSKWSTSVRPRWSRKAYIMWKNPHEEGEEKREEENTVAYKRTLMWWSIFISKILISSDRRSFDHNSFLFVSDCFLTAHNLLLNSSKPCSLTHTLQNSLYWAFWTRILYNSGLGSKLCPYNIYYFCHTKSKQYNFFQEFKR